MQNIIAAIFEVESEGYQAITQLKQAPYQTATSSFRWRSSKRRREK